MPPTLRKNKSGHLPADYDVGHDLCFVLHDLLAQLLKSGVEANIFTTSIEFKDDAERIAFESAPDVFAWLDSNRRVDERAQALVGIVLPAVLSDALHCIYEALECSRKGKLGTAYMLIRKPLQENLFLMEEIVLDRLDFAEKLAHQPMQLRGLKAGGVGVHTQRIERVLQSIGERARLSAAYIAQLRYDKSAQDGFDGICNMAMHLFTEHRAIKTDLLNINFIFSHLPEKMTQWSFLYSRLPYVMLYMYRVVEKIGSGFAATAREYVDDVERRVAALIILWWPTVTANYRTEPLEIFFLETEKWLRAHCREAGCRAPTRRDLYRMGRCGALPGESAAKVKEREKLYEAIATINRSGAEDDWGSGN
jgi:hypothetical protein